MNQPTDKANFLIEVTPEVLDELKRLYQYAENPNPYELHYSPYWQKQGSGTEGKPKTPTSTEADVKETEDKH